MDCQNGEPADQNASNEAGSVSEAQVQSYDIREPVGYALLLGCNTTPNQQHPSPSVREDLNSMEDTLKKIDWKTYSPCLDGTCAVDLTIDSCEQIINNLETPELSRYSCFMLYYSGHGVGSGIVGSNGRIVPYKDIVTKLSSLKAVEGKPKIFIFDCCRKKAEKELENLQNQFSKLDLSYNEEIEDHLRQDRLTNVYPPPDSILCFSACERSPAGITVDKTKGSYFTMKLCHTLLHFSRQLPFMEIVTQVYGGTAAISTNVFGVGQQPVVCSTLNKHLVLSPTDVRLRNSRLQFVTQDSPSVSDATSPSSPTRAFDVVSDAATVTWPIQRRVFKTKHDVKQNLTKLGEGVSVFMVYAPDPESPYHDPRTRVQEICANEKRIFRLAYDLEQHGFNVVTDLHLGSKMPTNWLEWYTSRIELCNYVLLVGSPAFCELFSREKPRGQIVDERAQRLRSYRNAVYAEIEAEVSRNPGAGKFVPVLLDPRWTFEDSVPSLMRAATVYRLLEDDHRWFDYDDGSRDFEKLVCRMAGINRAEIDRPPLVGVHRLPQPYQGGVVQPAPLPVLATKKPRIGYRVIRPPLPPTSGSTLATVPAAVGAIGGHHHHGYQCPTQPLAASTASPVPSVQPVQAGQQWYHPHGGMIPSLKYCTQYTTVPPSVVYPSSVGGYHHTIPPMQVQQSGVPQQPISQPAVPLPNSLPDIEPDSAMFLWLSDELVGWPFIARYLGFAEPTIERIKEENPHNVSEQCYQMLDKWYRQRPTKFSCQVLGDAVFKSERNKQLYPVFVQRVMALLQTQTMDTST